MPENKSKSKKEESGFPFKYIIIPAIATSVLFFVIIALGTLLFLKNSTGSSAYLPFSIGGGAVCGFICGFITGKMIKSKGLFYGALSGFIQSLIISFAIFVMNKGVAGNGIFILIAVTVAVSSIGGIIAVNLKKKIKY